MMIVILLILLCVAMTTMVLIVLPSTKDRAGEKLVSFALKRCFPKDTVIIDDLYFHNGRRSCQIDHLVVSPKGIFVVETKNFLGLVYGDASDRDIKRSVLMKHYSTFNPAVQNERHLDYLRSNFPSVAAKADALRSIIVFAFGTRLRLRSNPGNIGILRQLPEMIRRYGTASLSAGECRKIADEIQRFNRRRKPRMCV